MQRFNRTENVRPIPATDPDFARLYPRRLDAECINRGLDDRLWIGRAHTVGHARQHLNLLGFALVVNGVAIHRYGHRRTRPARGVAPGLHCLYTLHRTRLDHGAPDPSEPLEHRIVPQAAAEITST